ncbi:outer membrane lipoprotein-sorting protein [Trinickia sp. EG282A]|uniref:outer membrane lipoprotein-sorting protein n=1 Tax=Trinickia sp. EG282A TaxID=3237013 RepID=UPI0034D1588F
MTRLLWLEIGLVGCVAATTLSATTATAAAAASTKVAKVAKAVKPAAADKSGQAISLPSLGAEQIVERSIAASGGLQAWRAANTMVMSGQIEVGGKHNVTLPFTMTMKRPKKSRFEVRFDGQTAFQVYDGAEGWKVRPFLGRDEVDPYTPAEVKQAAEASELDGLLVDHAQKGTKIALAGTEKVEGHGAYKLKLTLKDGTQRMMWVDATSFLQLKVEGDPRKLDGRIHPVFVFLRDYRNEGGLKVPHVIETAVQGVKQTHKMTIEHVAVNAAVDDALFAKPTLAMAKAAAQTH